MPDLSSQKNNIFLKYRKFISLVLLFGFLGISGPIYPAKAIGEAEAAAALAAKAMEDTKEVKINQKGDSVPTANFWQDIVIGPLKAFSSALQNFDYGDVLQLVLRNTLNKIIDKFYKNVAKTFEEEYRVTDPFTQLWPYYTQLGFVKLHNKVREAVGGKMAAPLLDVYTTLEQLASNYVMNVGTGLTVEIFKKLNWVVEQTGEVTPDTLHKKQRAGDPDYYNLGMQSVGNDMMSTTFKVLGGILDQQAKSEAAANMDYTSSDGLNKASSTTGLPEEGLKPIQTYWIEKDSALNVVEMKNKLDEWGYIDKGIGAQEPEKKGEYAFTLEPLFTIKIGTKKEDIMAKLGQFKYIGVIPPVYDAGQWANAPDSNLLEIWSFYGSGILKVELDNKPPDFPVKKMYYGAAPTQTLTKASFYNSPAIQFKLWPYNSDVSVYVGFGGEDNLGGHPLVYAIYDPSKPTQRISSFSFTSRPSYDPLASGWTGLVQRPAQMVKQYLQDVVNTRFKVANEAEDLTGMSKIMYEMMDKFTDAINFKLVRATSGPLKGCPVGFKTEIERLDKDMRQLDEPTHPSQWSCFLKAIGQIGIDTLPKFLGYVSGLAGKLICWVFDVNDELPDAANRKKSYQMVSDTDPSIIQVDPGAKKLKFKIDPTTGEETWEPEVTSEKRNITEAFLRRASQFLIYVKLIKPHLPEWMLPSDWLKEGVKALLMLFGLPSSALDYSGGGMVELLEDFIDSVVFSEIIQWVLAHLGFCGATISGGGGCGQTCSSYEQYPPLIEVDFLEFPYEISSAARVKAVICEGQDETREHVREISVGNKEKGVHILRWDLEGEYGIDAAPGEYVVKIFAGGKVVKCYAKASFAGICTNPETTGKPDFAVVDVGRSNFNYGIEISEPNPVVGEEISITYRWSNRGSKDMDYVWVALYEYENVGGNYTDVWDDSRKIEVDKYLINHLPAGSAGSKVFKWTADKEGAHAFRVYIDPPPGMDITEACDHNNWMTETVNVSESANVRLRNWHWSDDNNIDHMGDGDASQGDSASIVTPGESIEIYFDVQNLSNVVASGIQAELDIPPNHPCCVSDPVNRINKTIINLPDIPPNDIVRPPADFNFSVRPNTPPDNYSLDFILRDAAGHQVYKTALIIPVKTQCGDGIDNDQDGLIDFDSDPGCTNPVDNDESGETTLPTTYPIIFVSCSELRDYCEESAIPDCSNWDWDNDADPGERIKLYIKLKNTSTTETIHSKVTLSTQESDVTIREGYGERIYPLDPGEMKDKNYQFIIAQNYNKNTITFNLRGIDENDPSRVTINTSFDLQLGVEQNMCSERAILGSGYGPLPGPFLDKPDLVMNPNKEFELTTGASISPVSLKKNLSNNIAATTQTYYQPLTLKQRIGRVWNYVKESLFP